jgi:hypothetical protein
MKTAIVLVAIVVGAAGIGLEAAAEPGITPHEIVFAQVAAFEGPTASLGTVNRLPNAAGLMVSASH